MKKNTLMDSVCDNRQAMEATGMLRTLMAVVAAAVCTNASAAEPTDADVKAQYVKAGRCRHAEDMDSNYAWAFRMAGSDTNRYARILRELAEEVTNQTRNVIIDLRFYRTPRSLPFLYAYSTNALYGADALRAIFAIEGVTSNSVAAAQGYLALTNDVVLVHRGGATVCADLVRCAKVDGVDATCRSNALDIVNYFAMTSNKNHYWLDSLLMKDDPTYRFSKRRLAVLRSADLPSLYSYQVNYVTNAINELVAYPEANLPD